MLVIQEFPVENDNGNFVAGIGLYLRRGSHSLPGRKLYLYDKSFGGWCMWYGDVLALGCIFSAKI
jgi:hypothetical protein